MKEFFALLLIFILTACTATNLEDTAPLPQLTYEHLKPVTVDVARIEFTNKADRAAKAWDIANEMVTPPDLAVVRYLNQRFKAGGDSGVLEITLQKAMVSSRDVPNDDTILSFIPFANEKDYTFEVVIDFQSLYRSGQPDASNSNRFVRRIQIPFNSNLAYKEARLQRTLEELIRDIDANLIRTLVDTYALVNRQKLPGDDIRSRTALPPKGIGLFEFGETDRREVYDPGRDAYR